MEILGYSLEAALGLCFLGFAVGTLGTMIGAGGGFLLVPALLLLFPHERPETIAAISLAVVFFNAASGSLAYAYQRRIDYRSGLIFAAASMPGALLGAYTTNYISRRSFDSIFGLLMLLLGSFVIAGTRRSLQTTFVAPPKTRDRTSSVTDRQGEHYTWSYSMAQGVGLSLGVGYLSSLLGIGGGIIHVPALVRLLRFPVRVATATSHFILALVALVGTLTHLAMGTFAQGSRRTAFLSVGVVLGAQLGAILSHKIKGVWILQGLGIALCFVGIRLLITH
jgi:uncharacterized membrane protein YfcA